MTLARQGGVHDVGQTWRGAGRWPDMEGCRTLARHGGCMMVFVRAAQGAEGAVQGGSAGPAQTSGVEDLHPRQGGRPHAGEGAPLLPQPLLHAAGLTGELCVHGWVCARLGVCTAGCVCARLGVRTAGCVHG